MKTLLAMMMLTGMLVGCSQENEKITADWLQGNWVCVLTYFDYDSSLKEYQEGRSDEIHISFKNVDGEIFANDTAFDLEKTFNSGVSSIDSSDYSITNNVSVQKSSYDKFSFITESDIYDKSTNIKTKNKSEMICMRMK